MMIHKRTILAVACISALGGAAQAQSSVTLYGLIDVNLTHLNYGDTLGSNSTWLMNDGTVNGVYGSRWGIRSTEDLGGGLKTQVVLESGFGIDTGASFQGGRLFGRQAFIALISDNYGELRIGRQYTPTDGVNGAIGAPLNGLAMNPSLPVTNTTGSLPQWVTPGRLDNLVQYISPKFGGFDFALLAAPGEGVNDQYQGVRVSYAGGKFATSAAYEWNKDKTTGSATNKLASAAAYYNFGPVKVTGGLQRASELNLNPGNSGGLTNLTVTGPTTFVANQTETYTVGVAVPVSAQLTAGMNYYNTKYSGAGQSLNLAKIGIGARYALSKNTELYTAFTGASGDLKEYIREKSVFQLGMNTKF